MSKFSIKEMLRSKDEKIKKLESSLHDLATKAKAVMDDLEHHGPGVVPHLMDTDENDGERLREAIRVVFDEAVLAEAMRDEIRSLADRYGKHEHLSGWAQELRDMAEEIDAVIEDTEGVE